MLPPYIATCCVDIELKGITSAIFNGKTNRTLLCLGKLLQENPRRQCSLACRSDLSLTIDMALFSIYSYQDNLTSCKLWKKQRPGCSAEQISGCDKSQGKQARLSSVEHLKDCGVLLTHLLGDNLSPFFFCTWKWWLSTDCFRIIHINCASKALKIKAFIRR